MVAKLIWYWVVDFDNMRQFYEDVLGLKLVRLDEFGGWAEYESGIPNFHIAIHEYSFDEEDEEEYELETGVGGILTFATPDIYKTHQQFLEKNVECEDIVTDEFVTRFNFWDPEGNPFQMIQM
ncbi:MAG: VOC family protein [bacterium]|nr:VOC family protein [bacterium]